MKKAVALLSIMLFSFLVVTPWFAATSNSQDITRKFEPQLQEDNLFDVTKRNAVRGIRTSAKSGGYGEIGYENGEFSLFASFHDLSEPREDDFYEGWLVQRDPFKFISTGELIKKDNGDYHNIFTSDVDYSSYDFYVLTLEPNDGNPDPADHIIEGVVDVRDASVVNNIYVRSLENVTGGKLVRGVITPKRASGYAEIGYDSGVFSLNAVFDSLWAPKWDDFYEGWLVQRDPFKFISTGKLSKKSGWGYHNEFASTIDYSSYDFYVLTLEPNDGNPDPADHVFEGEVVTRNHAVNSIVPTATKTVEKEEKREVVVLNSEQRGVRDVILSQVWYLSQNKIDIVLSRVSSLKQVIAKKKISDSKRNNYNKTLDLFSQVLRSWAVTK